MLGISLRDDSASVIVGTVKKDRLTVSKYERISGDFLSHLENIKTENDVAEAAANFGYLFDDIQQNAGLKKESEVYLVLPDYLFAAVDCFKYYNDEEIKSYIGTKLVNDNIENYYYNTPVFTKPTNVEKMVTAYVINKNIINCILQAAQGYNLHIISVEAMSISFLRSLSKFEREEIFLEVFNDHATLIGYSAIAGLFKMDVPDLSKNNLLSSGILSESVVNSDEANDIIRETLSAFETTADLTFEFFNPDIPILIIAGKNIISSYSALNNRINSEPDITAIINRDRVLINDLCPFMVVAGTLLQGIDFTAEKFDNILAKNQLILPGNVIPEEINTATKMQLMLKKVEKFSLITIAIFSFFIIAELSALFIFSSASIPNELQQEFTAKQESIKTIEKGLSLIDKYTTEHEYPVLALKHIIKQKPDKIYFTQYNIADHPMGQVGNKWVELKAVSEDPLLFQDFLINLSKDSVFKDIIITQINSESSGYKTATFLLSKGDVHNEQRKN